MWKKVFIKSLYLTTRAIKRDDGYYLTINGFFYSWNDVIEL